MGAGKGEEGEPGMLEASPGAIALVILFFLVTTLAFEHGLHALRKFLQRRNKKGLLKATNNLANEIMLLGVASLVLMACTPTLTRVCTTKEHTFRPWLDNVKPCACCLSRTKGVSPCFLKERQCPADFADTCDALSGFKGVVIAPDPAVCAVEPPEASADKLGTAPGGGEDTGAAGSTSPEPAQGEAPGVVSPASEAPNAGEAPAAPAAGPAAPPNGRRLRAAPPKAAAAGDEGPTCAECKEETYPQCGHRPGYAPAITASTLEQVHMLLFFAAVTHIVCSMLALLLGNLKLRLWARLAGKAAEDDLAARALAAAAGNSQAADSTQQVHVKVGPTGGATQQGSGASAADIRIPENKWRGRPETVQGFRGWAREVGVMAWRILLAPLTLTVTTQEYSLIRARFYYHHSHIITAAQQAAPSHQAHADDSSHGPDHSFSDQRKRAGSASQQQQLPQVAPKGHEAAHPSWLAARNWRGVFAMYLSECLERDSAKAVGLGLPMWVMLLAFVLVSGGIGWATWVFSVVAGALLLALNTLLMWRLRHLTAGGRVHEPKIWRIRQRWILELIKLLLFFLSFVVGQSIFFAVFFGPDSCFFSQTGFQSRVPLSWYIVLLLDVVMLFCLALFTLPLYSIILHTTQVDAKLLQQQAQHALLHQQPPAAGALELPSVHGV